LLLSIPLARHVDFVCVVLGNGRLWSATVSVEIPAGAAVIYRKGVAFCATKSLVSSRLPPFLGSHCELTSYDPCYSISHYRKIIGPPKGPESLESGRLRILISRRRPLEEILKVVQIEDWLI
jgi:hypothetical protein